MQQNSKWLTIWTKPRQTIRKIIDTNPLKNVILLASTNGILASITWLATHWMKYPQEKKFFHPFWIILILVLGVLGGLANLYVGSFLYRWIGSWIGGKGSFQDVKCAFGWSNYPYIVSGLFGLIAVLFTNHPLLQFPFALLNVILLIWGFIIFLKMVGEAHRFSAWKTLAVVLIAAAFIFAVVFIVTLLIVHFATPTLSESSRAIKIFDKFS